MAEFREIALLIDAENTQLTKLNGLVEHLSQRGRISIRRAYANWSLPQFRVWDKLLNYLAIQPEQHFSYCGCGLKNATDIALTIGAMDLLYRTNCDACVIVSSDSDFTPLARRLREGGLYVIGVGKGKHQTPDAFRHSCNEFINIDQFDAEYAAPKITQANASSCAEETSPAPATPQPPPPPRMLPVLELSEETVHQAFQSVAAAKANTDRYAPLTEAGTYLHEQYPGHKLCYAGHTRLLAFLSAYPSRYEICRGPAKVVNYRCLEAGRPAPSVALSRLHIWLRRIAERNSTPEGYTCVGHAGYLLRRFAEEEATAFNIKQYGHSSLSKFLKAYPKLYEVREDKRNGTTIIYYKSL